MGYIMITDTCVNCTGTEVPGGGRPLEPFAPPVRAYVPRTDFFTKNTMESKLMRITKDDVKVWAVIFGYVLFILFLVFGGTYLHYVSCRAKFPEAPRWSCLIR